MSSCLCVVLIALTRAWVRLYTLGMSADMREERTAEIESDLWETRHDSSRSGSWSRTLQLLRRLCAGMINDIAWRMEVAPCRELATAASGGSLGPSFHIIEARRPKPESIAAGMLTSMLMFASFGLLLEPREFATSASPMSEGPGTDLAGGDSLDPDDAGSVTVVAGSRDQFIAAVADLLNRRYFDRNIGWQLAGGLLVHQTEGHYDSASTWPELVDRINRHIHEGSQAAGVLPGAFVADVVYSESPLPSAPPSTPADCFFERAETLPNNIGYLKVNGFAAPAGCGATASRTMAAMNEVDALIVDLRDNGGGIGEAAWHIAGYFFDRPQFLYDPREHSLVPRFTASPVSGNRLAETPLYLLTSTKTQSAAEYFVYNLRMLKRATVVGERTAGKQHAGTYFRINDRAGVAIQSARPPKNPFPTKGWEYIGIVPDVSVSSAEALDAAIRLAGSNPRRSSLRR